MQFRISAGRIGAVQNRRRSKSAQKKKKLTLLYLVLIKNDSYAKFIVLRLMVTRYIGNMIAFFALPLGLSVNHYYKQVISAQSQ